MSYSAAPLLPIAPYPSTCHLSRMNPIDERIAQFTRGLNVDCSSGCSWCCQQLVVLTHIADGEAILRRTKQNMTDEAFRQFEHQVREQAKAISQLSYEEAEVKQWPCPLLKDDQCSVYDIRPIACRSVFSSDSDCCRSMLEAEHFEQLSAAHQKLAGEIGERAIKIQFDINDRRPIDGAFELRELLVLLLDQAH